MGEGEIPEYLSAGFGVQSTTMAMMAAYGEIAPMPKAAIFADTGAEPAYVYDTLEAMRELLPFPVLVVQRRRGLKNDLMASIGGAGARIANPPFYAMTADGEREGMLRRQCTREYKVEPLTQKIRELVGLQPRQRAPAGQILARQWLGISWDERQRMKDPREKWLEHRWPLIELEMTRGECLDWMQAHNLPLPGKSACTFCPYRKDEEWREMRDRHPEAWLDAVRIDEAIRGGVQGTTSKLFVHRSLTPLADADLSDSSEHQLSLLDECDGMCGT